MFWRGTSPLLSLTQVSSLYPATLAWVNIQYAKWAQQAREKGFWKRYWTKLFNSRWDSLGGTSSLPRLMGSWGNKWLEMHKDGRINTDRDTKQQLFSHGVLSAVICLLIDINNFPTRACCFPVPMSYSVTSGAYSSLIALCVHHRLDLLPSWHCNLHNYKAWNLFAKSIYFSLWMRSKCRSPLATKVTGSTRREKSCKASHPEDLHQCCYLCSFPYLL